MPPAGALPPPPLAGRGVVLTRIAGIELALHPSWLVTFGLLTLATRYKVVPMLAPNMPGELQWGMALVIATAFGVSVVLHELAHSLVARSYALDARRITLFLFGGVSQVGKEPPHPAAEFHIAMAGPLASLLIASVLAACARLLHPGEVGVPGVWGTIALVNLLLAAFNLIPGFPLDGGRILRSVLWAALSDRARATRLASYGGRVLAIGLMGVGLAFLARSNGSGDALLGGFWYLLLGWFLFGAVGTAARLEGVGRDAEGERPDTLNGDEGHAQKSHPHG